MPALELRLETAFARPRTVARDRERCRRTGNGGRIYTQASPTRLTCLHATYLHGVVTRSDFEAIWAASNCACSRFCVTGTRRSLASPVASSAAHTRYISMKLTFWWSVALLGLSALSQLAEGTPRARSCSCVWHHIEISLLMGATVPPTASWRCSGESHCERINSRWFETVNGA